MGQKKNAYRIFVGKRQGRRQLARPIREMIILKWGGINWIDLVQNRDQWRIHLNTVMNLRVPYNVAKLLSS
jgi:hypothetical protein